MRGRYQIILSTGRSRASANPHRFWSRFKAALIGVGFLIVAVAILMVALIFGSILAAALWVCLVIVVVTLILKGTWRKLKRGQTRGP